jgi:hypothetical protein
MFCPPISIAARAPKAQRRPSRHKLSSGEVGRGSSGPLARLAGPLFTVWWAPPREPGDFLSWNAAARVRCSIEQ